MSILKNNIAFRDFLAQSGLLDQMMEVLIDIYEDPKLTDDPLAAIRDKFEKLATVNIQEVLNYNEELKERVQQLEEDLQKLLQ